MLGVSLHAIIQRMSAAPAKAPATAPDPSRANARGPIRVGSGTRLPLAGFARVSTMGDRKADAADFPSEREEEDQMRGVAERLGFDLVLLDPELDVSGRLPLE